MLARRLSREMPGCYDGKPYGDTCSVTGGRRQRGIQEESRRAQWTNYEARSEALERVTSERSMLFGVMAAYNPMATEAELKEKCIDLLTQH